MKHLFTTCLMALLYLNMQAQDIAGQWNGLLKVQGVELNLIFHLSKTATGYAATMDSPDQGAKGIPVTGTTFQNDSLSIHIAQGGISYLGVLTADNTFKGTFKQGGMSIPLDLSKKAVAKTSKPQEPQKPYPYHSEDVTYENSQAGNRLAGTLTMPKEGSNFPVVILISGSGPQNRDEEILGHKPFLVIADQLTKNGFAVLRFDDRGTAQSTGDFKTATSADFATDVEAGIAYLKTRKEINPKKIGLIGHSEGGLIAPMVANRSKNVAFMVLLAAPGLPGDELLLLQQKLIGKATGTAEDILLKNEEISKKTFNLLRQSSNDEALRPTLTTLLQDFLASADSTLIPQGMKAEQFVKMQVDQLVTPWMQYFIKYDPIASLEKLSCPVLALNGEKDLQVPAQQNLAAIRKALNKSGNKNVVVKELAGLNHLFQESKTGSPQEYAIIEQTFSPIALAEITTWLHSLAL